MESLFQSLYRPFIWLVIMIFIIIYPMMISIYVFLPLFVGVMGYYFLRGIEEEKFTYLFVSTFYFMNLEINLSLPLFLTMISFLLVYVFFYKNLNYFRRCQICKPVFAVILIDIVYLGLLLSYDFLFQTTSIVLDNLLVYSLIVDILVVMVL